jgi:phosphoribosyl 1,2-cyclic phosphate phosphodiesterase
MTFKFLGTGTSVGVPQIGCKCEVCTSNDPRDKRRRCGAYVRTDEGAFLIDTPPEMRVAALEYGIDKVDAVVLTHSHMDHVAGFDDVRRFNTINGVMGPDGRIVGAPMNCYAMPETIEQMHRIFPYVKPQVNELGLYRPMINFVEDDIFSVAGVQLKRLKVSHGFECCGYLIGGKIGYISDCNFLPEETISSLQGIDVMILNCLRQRPHPTHLNMDKALGYLERINPSKAYLIHMCHDFSHKKWLEMLPDGIEPAYDGLEINI